MHRLLLILLALAPATPAFDRASLATISPIVVVRLATARYQMIGYDDDDKKAAMSLEIDALGPKVATLVWLAILENDVSVSSVDGQHVPAKFFATPYFLSRMLEALKDAGLSRQAARFADATRGRERAIQPGKAAEINLADSAGIELGDAFGTHEDLDAGLLAFIAKNTSTADWLKAARQSLTPADRAQALQEMLLSRPDAFGPAARANWPEAYRILWLTNIYLGELFNGGMEQFFSNSSGNEVPQTAEAMLTLGLPKQADMIRKGMSFFPNRYPVDRKARLAELQVIPGLTDRLDSLTASVRDDSVAPALLAYAEREGILPH